MPDNRGLVLFAHGARDADWAVPVMRVADDLSRRHPALMVTVAFLEFMRPTLDEAVAKLVADSLCREGQSRLSVDILPFFIAQGGHLRKELPVLIAQLRESYPQAAFNLLPPLGEIPAVQQAISDAVTQLIIT